MLAQIAHPGRWPLSWLWTLYKTSDETLLSEVGLDGMVHIGLVRLGLEVTLMTLWFDLSITMWADITGLDHLDRHKARLPTAAACSRDAHQVCWASSRSHAAAQNTDLDVLSIANVKAGDKSLWVHFASVLLKTGVVLRLLKRFSKWVFKQQVRPPSPPSRQRPRRLAS